MHVSSSCLLSRLDEPWSVSKYDVFVPGFRDLGLAKRALSAHCCHPPAVQTSSMKVPLQLRAIARARLVPPLHAQRSIALPARLVDQYSAYRPSLAPSVPRINPLFIRHFHPSRRRQDVFFVAFPALKSGLLNVTRFTLLFLPFVFRYKWVLPTGPRLQHRLWRKYRKTSFLLIQIPVSSFWLSTTETQIFAFCIVLALGLDQSPRTGRWRLLLMSENEELAWSRRK